MKRRKPKDAVEAAKEGLGAARDLALPAPEPELGVDHEYDKHIRRIEVVVNNEAAQSERLRMAVDRLLRTVKVLVPAMIVLFIAVVVVFAFAYVRISRVAKENRRLVVANAQTQVVAARRARNVIREACESQNGDRRKLRIIIARSETTIPALVKEGTITQAQADRALRDSRRARRELRPDDCSSRAERIPIPKVRVP